MEEHFLTMAFLSLSLSDPSTDGGETNTWSATLEGGTVLTNLFLLLSQELAASVSDALRCFQLWGI